LSIGILDKHWSAPTWSWTAYGPTHPTSTSRLPDSIHTTIALRPSQFRLSSFSMYYWQGKQMKKTG